MGDYTKLTHSEIEEVLRLYTDDMLMSVRPLSLGISNSNYDVRTKESHYLIKVSNDKNIDELKEEMKILEFLHKERFPHSLTPVSTKTNELVYEYNDLHGVVFPFVEGIPPGPSDDTCYEIGKALALLHNITVNKDSGLRSADQVSFTPSIIKDYLLNENCPEDFKNTYESLIGPQEEQYFSTSFDLGIIHGDLYYDNTLFDNNHLSYLLDFEQSGVGDCLFDLGISISGSCLEKGRISPSLIESYLAGYESIRILKDSEKELIDISIYFGLLSIALWRIKRFKEGNLNPYMADSYKELLNRALIYKLMANY